MVEITKILQKLKLLLNGHKGYFYGKVVILNMQDNTSKLTEVQLLLNTFINFYFVT